MSRSLLFAFVSVLLAGPCAAEPVNIHCVFEPSETRDGVTKDFSIDDMALRLRQGNFELGPAAP